MKSLEFLEYQKASFEKTKSLNGIAEIIKVWSFLNSCATVFLVSEKSKFISAFFGFLSAILIIFFSIRVRIVRDSSEQARRVGMVSEGMGMEISGKFLADFLSTANSPILDTLPATNTGYYGNTEPVGYSKMAALLEECLFWSKNLYRKCFIYSAIKAGTGFLISIILFLAIIFSKNESMKLGIAELTSVILAWFVTSEYVMEAFLYNRGVFQAHKLEEKVAHLRMANPTTGDLMVVLGDYNSIVEGAPIIPSHIYNNEEVRLNKIWKMRFEMKTPAIKA